MKWVLLFFALASEASELEIMRTKSISELVQLQDQDSQQKKLFEICRLEKEQMVLPVACLELGQLIGEAAEIFCIRAKSAFFIEVEAAKRTAWPKSCQDSYLQAEERKAYRESF